MRPSTLNNAMLRPSASLTPFDSPGATSLSAATRVHCNSVLVVTISLLPEAQWISPSTRCEIFLLLFFLVFFVVVIGRQGRAFEVGLVAFVLKASGLHDREILWRANHGEAHL